MSVILPVKEEEPSDFIYWSAYVLSHYRLLDLAWLIEEKQIYKFYFD